MLQFLRLTSITILAKKEKIFNSTSRQNLQTVLSSRLRFLSFHIFWQSSFVCNHLKNSLFYTSHWSIMNPVFQTCQKKASFKLKWQNGSLISRQESFCSSCLFVFNKTAKTKDYHISDSKTRGSREKWRKILRPSDAKRKDSKVLW